MTVDYLTVEELLSVAADLNADQVRDLGLLESAAHRPRTGVMGQTPTRPCTRRRPCSCNQSCGTTR